MYIFKGSPNNRGPKWSLWSIVAKIERDPKKRRVKPVESHMLQLDFGGLDDSEDDSDFSIGDHQDHEQSGSASNISSNESDSGDDDSNTEIQNNTCNDETKSKSIGDLYELAKQKQALARQRISSKANDKLYVKICCVCLGDISEEEDEIVECDNCGISVHEGCYGITDCESVSSTASSSSTEPWFCDACKAGKKDMICELCPNRGGIFKETEIGRWVHLVCALYIPGVAFGEVERLSPVTLFEMPYSKWGTKVCTLCEDDRYSRTGVCISCDAGMCRTYFHVTCAQREGLLSEASQDEEIADPFFAYCKLHAEKNSARCKKNNWLALQCQSKTRNEVEKKLFETKEELRIARKLNHHRQKYMNNKKIATKPWVPTQKMPRLLTSSPAVCQKLIRKAELMGINNQSLHIPMDGKMIDIRRKWHIPPAFNIDFVCYYLDRNERMLSMKRKLDELIAHDTLLQSNEKDVRQQYEEITSKVQNYKAENTKLKQKGIELYDVLKLISNKIPELFQQKRTVNQSPKTPKSGKKGNLGHLIMQCGICEDSNDQHQMAKCDNCHLHYHLNCLDPPLTRMPKKNKQQGWQCSECDRTEGGHETDTTSLDPDAPRSLRRHPKPPAKFVKSLCVEDSSKTEKRASKKRRAPKPQPKSAPKTKKTKETPEKESLCKEPCDNESMDVPVRFTRSGRRTRTSTESSQSQVELCIRCAKPGDDITLVKCDNCGVSYHVQCIDPPLKKSPKIYGMTWFCADCCS
ncbi:PHD finger protein 14 [Nymphon striatum]|nr:PHD finger protein 14 [Nymphon striatum]